MESSLADILDLASKTGDTVIVLREASSSASVILPLEKYKHLIGEAPTTPAGALKSTALSAFSPILEKKKPQENEVKVQEETVDEPFFLEPLE